jgi:outer membrane immunogenic protein
MAKHIGCGFHALLAGALTLAAGAASAADLNGREGSLKDAPSYVAPINTWTGFYIGVNGGYGWSANDRTLTTSTDFVYADGGGTLLGNYPTSLSKLSPEGAFGGGQIGYNTQRGNLVFGVEIDAQGADISDRFSKSIDASDLTQGLTLNTTAKSSLDWFATLRGRLGYSFDRLLVYATGGFAVGGVNDTLTITSTPDYGSATFKNSEARVGYVVGGGLEYLLTPAWSLKAEYQHIDLGDSSIKGTILVYSDAFVAGGALTTNKIDHTYDTVRVGLNYHFGRDYEPLK